MIKITLALLSPIMLIISLFSVTFQRLDNQTYRERVRLGRGTAETVVWHPDGSVLAVGGTLGIWVYTDDFQDVAHLGDRVEVSSMAWHPDGNQLASIGYDGMIHVWNLETGQLQMTIEQPDNAVVTEIVWNPDGTTFASADNSGWIWLWNIDTGNVLSGWHAHEGPVTALSWNPENSYLASAGLNTGIRIWDAADQQLVTSFQEGNRALKRDIAWSPDGRILAVARVGVIDIWDIAKAEPLVTLRGHGGEAVNTLAWSPDGNRIASGAADHSIQLWDVTSGNIDATIDGQAGRILAIAWNPVGDTLVSTGSDNTVSLWDASTTQLFYSLPNHNDVFTTVAWSFDSASVAASDRNGKILIWNSTSGELQASLNGSSNIKSLAWSPNGVNLAYFDEVHHSTSVVDISTGTSVFTGDVRLIGWSADGLTLAGVTREATLIWIDITTGQTTAMGNLPELVYHTVWFPNEQLVACATYDGAIHIFDMSSGLEPVVLGPLEGSVQSMAWSPDGANLISTTRSGEVIHTTIWDTVSGEKLQSPPAFDLVAWHPEEQLIAATESYGLQNDIVLWDSGKSRSVQTLVGHDKMITGLVWSVDGAHLASSSNDFTLRVWE